MPNNQEYASLAERCEGATGEQGESTVEWFCNRGGFWGTSKQLCLCARCGKSEIKRHDEPRHYARLCTPHIHLICDSCFDALPDDAPSAAALRARSLTVEDSRG